MLDVIEDVRNEFKVKLTDKFEEEVISFLNTNGGNIYIGVNDKGDIIGINGNIDLLQRTIKDRIKDYGNRLKIVHFLCKVVYKIE